MKDETLRSERLILKELEEADIADIHRMNCYREVAMYNTIGIPKNLAVTRNLLQPILDDQTEEKRTSYIWTVRSYQSGVFLGEVGLNLKSEKYSSGEIYYSFLPEYWGFGYGKEAASRVLSHCFYDLRLHRMTAGVGVENHRSVRLLESLGMRREGHCRKILPIRGEWHDNYEYAILEEEWLQQNQ